MGLLAMPSSPKENLSFERPQEGESNTSVFPLGRRFKINIACDEIKAAPS